MSIIITTFRTYLVKSPIWRRNDFVRRVPLCVGGLLHAPVANKSTRWKRKKVLSLHAWLFTSYGIQQPISIYNFVIFNDLWDHFLSQQKTRQKFFFKCFLYPGIFASCRIIQAKTPSKAEFFFLPGPSSGPYWAKLTRIFTWFKSWAKVPIPYLLIL